MKDLKKIGIIGTGFQESIASTYIQTLADDITIIDNVPENQILNYSIIRMPIFPEPFIDPNAPVFNYRKHKQTCEKNKKARKKKRK